MLGDGFPAVLERARSGDDAAWGALYDDLAGPIFGFARGRGAPDPDDVVGETFLHVARALPSFSGDEDGFRAWVFTIAHRRVVDVLRQRARRPSTPLPDDELAPLAEAMQRSADDLELLVDRLADAGHLDALLDALTEEQREVLVLRFAADLDATTVGRLTGRTTNAVAAITRRALMRLREVVDARPADARSSDASPPADEGR
jgi:RNA polymerase sigma-70 factor (ECF subfamily)